MSSLKSPLPAANFDHGRRRISIVQAILAEVFHGRLRTGQRLVTQNLAERFGVSHTPVREALIELAAIGVIDLLPNRGAVVRRVTSRDVWEVCQVRRVLECEAVRAACGSMQVRVLRAFRGEIEKLQGPGEYPRRRISVARELDSRLHDTIAQACGNLFLAKELARLKILFHAFRDAAWEQEESRNDFSRLSIEAAEHLAVIDALIEGDPTRAAEAMAAHIRSGEHYWGRVIDQLNGINPSPVSK
jgi:DNA-binding GntR family transcriptional regulator